MYSSDFSCFGAVVGDSSLDLSSECTLVKTSEKALPNIRKDALIFKVLLYHSIRQEALIFRDCSDQLVDLI